MCVWLCVGAEREWRRLGLPFCPSSRGKRPLDGRGGGGWIEGHGSWPLDGSAMWCSSGSGTPVCPGKDQLMKPWRARSVQQHEVGRYPPRHPTSFAAELRRPQPPPPRVTACPDQPRPRPRPPRRRRRQQRLRVSAASLRSLSHPCISRRGDTPNLHLPVRPCRLFVLR